MVGSELERFQGLFRRLFRPLARVMIAHGVTIKAVTEIMKKALVDVVEHDARSQKYLTDSRVSLLTGLHRKDVRRLRREEGEPDRQRSFSGACALVIAFWTADDRFLDREGNPLVLRLTRRTGVPAFRELIKAASIDLPAATILQELENNGLVAIDPNTSRVTLLRRAYIPEGDYLAKLEAYEKNLEAHLAAATENLLSKEPEAPFFERAAHFNNLSAASVRKLEKLSRRMKQTMLESLNREALQHQKRDARRPGTKHRFSFGAYFYSTPVEKKAPEEEGDDTG